MTNLQLLKLAAKAAGYAVQEIDGKLYLSDGTEWNPLDFNGDAFRLMVDAGIPTSSTEVCCRAGDYWLHTSIPWAVDKPQAMRRAIVEVVAAVGNMVP